MLRWQARSLEMSLFMVTVEPRQLADTICATAGSATRALVALPTPWVPLHAQFGFTNTGNESAGIQTCEGLSIEVLGLETAISSLHQFTSVQRW